jgi:hypothetical protein
MDRVKDAMDECDYGGGISGDTRGSLVLQLPGEGCAQLSSIPRAESTRESWVRLYWPMEQTGNASDSPSPSRFLVISASAHFPFDVQEGGDYMSKLAGPTEWETAKEKCEAAKSMLRRREEELKSTYQDEDETDAATRVLIDTAELAIDLADCKREMESAPRERPMCGWVGVDFLQLNNATARFSRSGYSSFSDAPLPWAAKSSPAIWASDPYQQRTEQLVLLNKQFHEKNTRDVVELHVAARGLTLVPHVQPWLVATLAPFVSVAAENMLLKKKAEAGPVEDEDENEKQTSTKPKAWTNLMQAKAIAAATSSLAGMCQVFPGEEDQTAMYNPTAKTWSMLTDEDFNGRTHVAVSSLLQACRVGQKMQAVLSSCRYPKRVPHPTLPLCSACALC